MLLVWDVKKTLLKGDTVFAEHKTGAHVFINDACVPLLPSPAQQCSDCAKPVAHFFHLQISEGLEVLPGVEALLAALADRPNCVTGLVTGNLEPIGWAFDP